MTWVQDKLAWHSCPLWFYLYFIEGEAKSLRGEMHWPELLRKQLCFKSYVMFSTPWSLQWECWDHHEVSKDKRRNPNLCGLGRILTFFQGQIGRGFEQLDLEGGVPAHGRVCVWP